MLHTSFTRMSSNLWSFRWLCGAAISILAAWPAAAQNNFVNPQGGRSILHVDGTFKAMSRLAISVTDSEGTEIMVQLPQDVSKIRFHAEADPKGLRPGMMVRFDTSLGPGGVPLEPVKQVEIFHPLRGSNVPRRLVELVTPGLHAANKQANRNAGFVPGKYKVVGAIVGGDPGSWLAVKAGQYPIRVQLAPDAKFLIRTNSLELAQPGDRVTLDGFYNEPDKTKVLADSLTISTDRLIGTPTEGPPIKRRGRGREKRDAGAAAEGDAGEAAEAAE
ncbi:hypothetical protein UC8_39780 [Roseimaritima ulvae]|uniref:DUF5666 domain-containing protein n=2 Tax=Roseimaritima ulvae TaxID=980254 RepID=A0A5B9QVM3_9BACT|nr:hypothetical protein UC8_39780 [Roseimaritima ulvae]